MYYGQTKRVCIECIVLFFDEPKPVCSEPTDVGFTVREDSDLSILDQLLVFYFIGDSLRSITFFLETDNLS